MAARPVPQGYHTATPYLIVKGASQAIEFYKKAFGATDVMRFAMPDGNVAHAEIKIGDSHIMLADEWPDMGYVGPQTLKGTSCSILLYVEDSDALFDRAVAAGGNAIEAMQDKFYGDRSGTVVDPFGHRWTISTHKEDMTVEEMQRRAAKQHT